MQQRPGGTPPDRSQERYRVSRIAVNVEFPSAGPGRHRPGGGNRRRNSYNDGDRRATAGFSMMSEPAFPSAAETVAGETEDTIVAIATPPGRGGLGIVRLSGAQARSIAAGLLDAHDLRHGQARFARFRDRDGAPLDEVLATWFQAPRSYTAEDVVEISAHGSPVLLAALVERALEAGARLAEPGEFTRRAFLHGRIDLTQAEAVHDLIDAQTLFQARTAARQLGGSLAHRLQPLKERLKELIALMEAGIDFADDDVSCLRYDQILDRIGPLTGELATLLEGFRQGRTIREGLVMAILGRPNVGKSSLFNRLLDSDRAIVTATAGTTRDLVSESWNLDGIPLRLVDTAGIRDAEEEAEQIGVRKSWQAVADADLVLAVMDRSVAPTAADCQLLERAGSLPAVEVVLNKSDLPEAWAECWDQALARALPGRAPVAVSAVTGAGLADLRAALVRRVLPDLGHSSEFVTNIRHAEHLRRCRQALIRAGAGAEIMVPHEALMVDFYEALAELDAITGQTTVEDILGMIFSTFCIGK